MDISNVSLMNVHSSYKIVHESSFNINIIVS